MDTNNKKSAYKKLIIISLNTVLAILVLGFLVNVAVVKAEAPSWNGNGLPDDPTIANPDISITGDIGFLRNLVYPLDTSNTFLSVPTGGGEAYAIRYTIDANEYLFGWMQVGYIPGVWQLIDPLHMKQVDFEENLRITTVVELPEEGKYFKITYTLENISTGALKEVKFYEYVEPNANSYNTETTTYDASRNLIYSTNDQSLKKYLGVFSTDLIDNHDIGAFWPGDITGVIGRIQLDALNNAAGPYTGDSGFAFSKELGDITPGEKIDLAVYFVAGDTLSEIQIIVDEISKLRRILPDEAVELAKEVVDAPYHFKKYESSTKGFVREAEGYYFFTPDQVKNGYPGKLPGLDCSGLSFWSYNRAYYDGGELTKTEFEDRPLFYLGSNGQYVGNIDKELELTKEDLIPGDLLFFDTWNRNTATSGQDGIVDHVAMFIGLYEGEQYAIEHAHRSKDNTDNAGKISVTTVDGLIDYYKARFGEEAFRDFGRVIDAKVEMKFIDHSPIDLIITAPDGETIYENIGAREAISELGDIGDSLTMSYMVYDIDGDGKLDDIVASPERKIGDYLITVVAESGALPTDTYSLELESLINGEIVTTVLAEDVPISDIPRTPYIIKSTETEIVPIISAFVDFDPDTLNLRSKGKYVTAYIELPTEYDINDIDLESIRLNDQISVETKTEIGDYDNNGIPDLMIKFSRTAVQSILEVGEAVKITIIGELTNGSPFQGSDIIKVISKGKWGDISGIGFLAFFAWIGLLTYKRKRIFQNGTKGKILLIVSLVAVLFIGTILVYYWWTTKEKIEPPEEVMPKITEEKPSDWKTYKNEVYGFEIKYPAEWEADETHLGVGFSSKDYSWKPRFGYGTNFGIGVNSYSEIGAWGGCVIKGEEKIIAKDIKLYPIIYTYLLEEGIEGGKSPAVGEDCSQLPLWDSHFVDAEFCVDKDKQYLGKYCLEGSGNFYYQIGLSCGGEEWKGKEGMNKCIQLFNQIISMFRFIEK